MAYTHRSVTSPEDDPESEFVDTVASLFRELGYEDVPEGLRGEVDSRVREANAVATMRDGETVVLVAMSKVDRVDRPVVESLHRSLPELEHDGSTRGIVVTSGRFTEAAREYVRNLWEHGDTYQVELIDDDDLRALGDTVGMTIADDREGLTCDRTLPVGEPTNVVYEVFQTVENAPSRAEIPEPDVEVLFEPIVDVEARTQATFRTEVGVVHEVDHRDHLVIEADRSGPRLAPDSLVNLVGVESVPLEVEREAGMPVGQFGRTEADYCEWVKGTICDRLETAVTYTGSDDTTKTRTFRPGPDNVRLGQVRPLYVPRIKTSVELGDFAYHYVFNAAGDRHAPRVDGIHGCVNCDGDGPYTFCRHCQGIHCPDHVETDALTDEPVCSECAVSDEFFLATKYFVDESNRETYRERFEDMPVYRKPLTNPRLVAVAVALALLFVLFAVVVV